MVDLSYCFTDNSPHNGLESSFVGFLCHAVNFGLKLRFKLIVGSPDRLITAVSS